MREAEMWKKKRIHKHEAKANTKNKVLQRQKKKYLTPITDITA